MFDRLTFCRRALVLTDLLGTDQAQVLVMSLHLHDDFGYSLCLVDEVINKCSVPFLRIFVVIVISWFMFGKSVIRI